MSFSDTTGFSQGGKEGLLAGVLRTADRRPRAAVLIMIYDDETEVALHLPDDAEMAVQALKNLRRASIEAVDCLLRPKRCNA